MISILITSAGSRSVEAIIDCLQSVRNLVRIIGLNSEPAFACLEDLDIAYLVPITTSRSEYVDSIYRVIDLENPDVIINGRDEEVPLLAKISMETGIFFLGPDRRMADIFSDKYKTWQFCSQNSLPFVETAVDKDEVDKLITENGFPVIVKPRVNGHASNHVYILHDQKQVDYHFNLDNRVFQPFIAPFNINLQTSLYNQFGIAWVWNPINVYYMIDLVIGKTGEEIMRCITRAKRTGSIVKRLELAENQKLNEIADRHVEIFALHGIVGPINIQGYLDGKDEFIPFEWNARFIGSVFGYALLGKNLVLAALAYNFPVLNGVISKHIHQGILFRPMKYRLVNQEAVNTLSRDTLWKNPMYNS